MVELTDFGIENPSALPLDELLRISAQTMIRLP